MFINYIILTGVILSWKGNLFPQNGIINYASAELVKQKPSSLNSFSQEKQDIYDIELVKRIIGLKKLRERYRKRQYYEARQGLTSSKNYINSILKHKLWIKDPYRAASHFRYGRKRDFSEAAYEHGVFKVKNKNYFLWVESENDYISKEFGGEIEVKDPLKGLSDSEKKEKLKFITQTHKYNAPFRDTKATNFLRGVYYSFLSKSKNTSISQLEIDFSSENLNDKRELLDFDYFKKQMYLHTYIGILERINNAVDDGDDKYIKYLPLNYPKNYTEFYMKWIAITAEDGLKLFNQTYDLFLKEIEPLNNPEFIRIPCTFAYQIFTYGYGGRKPNWDYKVSKIFFNGPHMVTQLRFGRLIETDVYKSFYTKTGCIPQPTGIIVNPKVPFLSIYPDAVTYCNKQLYLVLFHKPLLVAPLKKIMKLFHSVQLMPGNNYKLKVRNKYYGMLQYGMYILNLNKSFLTVYSRFDKQSEIIEVDLDKQYIQKMEYRYYKAYFRYILPRIYYRFKNITTLYKKIKND